MLWPLATRSLPLDELAHDEDDEDEDEDADERVQDHVDDRPSLNATSIA